MRIHSFIPGLPNQPPAIVQPAVRPADVQQVRVQVVGRQFFKDTNTTGLSWPYEILRAFPLIIRLGANPFPEQAETFKAKRGIRSKNKPPWLRQQIALLAQQPFRIIPQGLGDNISRLITYIPTPKGGNKTQTDTDGGLVLFIRPEKIGLPSNFREATALIMPAQLRQWGLVDDVMKIPTAHKPFLVTPAQFSDMLANERLDWEKGGVDDFIRPDASAAARLQEQAFRQLSKAQDFWQQLGITKPSNKRELENAATQLFTLQDMGKVQVTIGEEWTPAHRATMKAVAEKAYTAAQEQVKRFDIKAICAAPG